MNRYFKQIDLILKDFELSNLKGPLITSYGKTNTSISYYEIKDHDLLRSLYIKDICTILPTQCHLAEVSGAGLLRPHRDHGPLCCLNYYFESNEAKTVFYKTKEDVTPYRYQDKETSNIYNLRDIESQCEFTAQNASTFLLNISEIHSVFCTKKGIRRFITWQWANTKFEDVLENLNYPIVD